jgi:rod shape-determining protein MreD
MGDYRPKIEHRVIHQLGCMGLLLLIALFQTALAPSLWYVRVDWVLVVVVCWTLLCGFAAGMRWALYGGLALDILSPLPIGSHLLALLVSVTAVAILSDGFPRDNRIIPTGSVLLGSLLYATCLGLVMSVVHRPIAWGRYPMTIVLPEALANGAAALPVFLLLDRFNRRNRPDMSFGI